MKAEHLSPWYGAWCQSARNVPSRPFQPVEILLHEAVLGMLVVSPEEYTKVDFRDEPDCAHQTYDMIVARLKALGAHVDSATVYTVCDLCTVAAESVLWAHVLHAHFGSTPYNLATYAEKVGMTFPTRDGMRALWESQKLGDGRNLLDLYTAILK